MPTWGKTDRFKADYAALSAEAQAKFLVAVGKLIEDLRRDGKIRSGLRVKGVQSAPGVHEMTWGGDGRATFEYGDPVVENETHIIWRRVGTHGIFGNP
ncbi:MAG: hypothetical protein WD556_07375 [Actinomycetota bacterium]